MSSLVWGVRSNEFLFKSKMREEVVYFTNTITMGNVTDKFRKGRPYKTQENSQIRLVSVTKESRFMKKMESFPEQSEDTLEVDI